MSWGGIEDYNNDVGIGKLNSACQPYLNTDYATKARSINIEDIDRITGFVKEDYKGEQVLGEGYSSEVGGYGNKVTYTLETDGDTLTYTVEGKSELNGSVKLSEYGGIFVKPDGTNLQAGETYVAEKNTAYNYSPSSSDCSKKAYYMLFRQRPEKPFSTVGAADYATSYWVASTGRVSIPFMEVFVVFNVHTNSKYTNSYVGISPLYDSGLFYSGRTFGESVRAVIYLKSDIQLNETEPNSGIWIIG